MTRRTISRATAFRRIIQQLATTLLVIAYTTTSAAETVTFDIKAGQPLAAALNQFAQQADQQLLFSSDIVSGRVAPGLSGQHRPTHGLQQLLVGSDLAFTHTDNDTVLISARQSEPAMAAKGSVSQDEPVNAGENSLSTVIVEGRVVEARTGRNLAGALVQLVEAEQETRTDYRGSFRFVGVKPGNYSLRASYLGFADTVFAIDTSNSGRQDTVIEMVVAPAANGLDEIVVYGTRSARAQSLNQERTAENSSTVIASDLLGNFSGTTLSEALRKAPGVTFQQDDATGDGSNIIIRGLSPELNTVSLNGIELPVSNGRDRSATLSNILADTVDSVTISKTLLPSQDSVGLGGIVDIKTKSPLDLPDRYYRFGAERVFGSGDFLEDSFVSGLVSSTFGAANTFGITASVQYRERKQERLSFETDVFSLGQYLPLGPGNQPNIIGQSFVDPRTDFPFDAGATNVYPSEYTANFGVSENTNLTASISGQWDVNENSSLRLDILQARNESDDFSRFYSFSTFPGYSLQPVLALGGEDRYALTSPSGPFSFFLSPFYGLTEGVEDETTAYTFSGETKSNRWTFNYSAGYTKGEFSTPAQGISSFALRNPLADFAELSTLLSPAAVDPVEGRILSPFSALSDSERFLLPLFSDAGFAFFNDPAANDISTVFTNDNATKSENDRQVLNFRARYDVSSEHLKYVEAGVQWERSDAREDLGANQTIYSAFFGAPTLGGLGYSFDDTQLSRIGGPSSSFGVLSLENYRQITGELSGILTDPASPYFSFSLASNPLIRDQFLEEIEIAPYFQARVDFDKLELIGGVRVSHVDLESNFLRLVGITLADFTQNFEIADRLTTLQSGSADDTAVLPRLLANYRHSDNLVLRGGYFRSLARPSIRQLSATQQITLFLPPTSGPLFDQPLLIVNEGNPNLKPTVTDNFDLGVEYYDDQIGVMKLSIFYKRIENLIESAIQADITELADVDLPDDPEFQALIPANIFVSGRRPVNNDDVAEIYGLEAVFEKQFTNLPGVFGGLGVFANYTYTKSKKEQPYVWDASPIFDAANNFIGSETEVLVFDDVPFNQSPEQSGTFALTYSKYNVDASLSYSYQDARLRDIGFFTDFRPNNMNSYDDAVDSLDLRVEYIFEPAVGQYRIFFEGLDLLKGDTDASQLVGVGGFAGTPSLISGATYRGGRSFRVGITGTFAP